jgi:multidrug resistance efflux pump
VLPVPPNSHSPAPSRLPKPRRWSQNAKIAIAVIAIITLGSGATGAWWLFAGFRAERSDLIYHTVQRERLQLTIVERGALESAENRDIVCRVKAKSPQNTIATSIRSVIDNGAIVEAGQLLAQLDDSAFLDQLQTEQANLEKAKADWITAVKAHEIQEITNDSLIATAKVKLDLAILELEKYKDGDYLQSKRTIEGKQIMARSDLEMWEERASWSERMSRPGRRYVTAAQAESDRSRLVGAGIALKSVDEEMRVLEQYTQRKEVKQRQSDIEEAKRNLDMQQKQAVAKLAQTEADRAAKYSAMVQQTAKVRDIDEEIRKCHLTAPQEGLVVYFVPEQSRSGSGTQQAIVAQGEPVREGQKLMSIPNLNKMLVNTRVHEAMISKVRGDRLRRTGFSDAVLAALSTSSSNALQNLATQTAFTQVRSSFSEEHQEQEQELLEKGQPALIRIDSIPGEIFRGRVRSVATVASQQDWLSSDVKVYQTMVSIDQQVDGVRPGMSAEVTILTDAKAEDVLAIPVEAIVATSEVGRKRKCFVKTPRGPVEREIVIGMSNETKAEVLDGLKEGDQVVLNPRVLLNPKDKVAENPAARKRGMGKGKFKGANGAGENGGAPPGEGNGNGNGVREGKKGKGRQSRGG